MTRKLRNKILGDSLIWVIIAAFVVIMLFPFGNKFNLWRICNQTADMESDHGCYRDWNDSCSDSVFCIPEIFYAVCSCNRH